VPEFHVILVEPKIEGNVGAIARSMMNFGLEKLILVNPCKIGSEAYSRAMHATSILDNAKTVPSLDEALKGMDFAVGSSSLDTSSEKKFLRIAMNPRTFSKDIRGVRGNIGLIFGREDYGLLNEELKRCDVLLKIPTSEEYPVLNIAHAASIIFYELFQNSKKERKRREASGLEKEKLYEVFAQLLDITNYPEHKKERTKIMFRRMMGRAYPSKWEFHALMGVFSGAIKKIKKMKEG